MGRLTLGSLFDGSGGFPLGGLLAGITPVWASEIEPFPIRVTTKRLPRMVHLGDVSSINGADVEPVDIITFGSPCTDMSIAGKRAGLNGAQSSLFYQAIRIIKEMRCATDGKYPRFIVWENVPGAFSSNKGEDFKAVLEAVIGIVEPGAEVPMPEKNCWPYADIYMGERWSAAYRTFNAQYWGVPQRRRRIYLVGDFAGQCAGQVLFESEGLSGYSAASFRSWQRAARNPAVCAGAASCTGKDGSWLRAPITAVYENHSQDSRYTELSGIMPAVSANYGTGGNNQPFVVTFQTYDVRFTSEGTKNARQNVYETNAARTIDTSGNPPDGNQGGTAIVEISAGIRPKYRVRRLTPTECAGLQGFPDWWCANLATHTPSESDIAFWSEVWKAHRRISGSSAKPKSRRQVIKWLQAPHSDAAEYKMWGNGVALPCVFFVLAGIVWAAQYSSSEFVAANPPRKTSCGKRGTQ